MKSVFRFFLPLFLLVLLVLPAHAGEYQLGDTGFAVTIPDELLIITPEVRADSPALDLLGVTRAQALKLLSDGDYCLLAFPSDRSFELNISAIKNAEESFESLSEGELEELLLESKESISEEGLDISYSKVLHPGGRPFLVLICHRVSSSKGDVDVLVCQTSLGTDLVTFSLHCYGIDLTKEHTDFVLSVLKSITPCSEETPPASTEDAEDSEVGEDTDSSSSRRGPLLTLLLYLLILFVWMVLFILPVCIYRFAIRRKVVSTPDRAKIIVLVSSAAFVLIIFLFVDYGLFAGFGYMSLIPASLINYRILAGPKKKRLQSPPADSID